MLEEMRRREWRQADFARAADIDVSMVSRWLQGRRPDPASLERVASALGVDLDALLTLAGHRPRSPRDDDPRVASLVAKVRQVTWTPERFLIVDALLDDLRQRSSRVPIEQVSLPGMDEGESPSAQGVSASPQGGPAVSPPQGVSLRSGEKGEG